jgi:PBP1b-binding outer membrane lipoprotein LpoB
MGQDQLIHRNPKRLLAAAVLLAAFCVACVSVQDASQSQPRRDAPKAETKPQDNSGFTVSETTVPTTPQSSDGYSVGETAVPKSP